jgi:major capsid protein gp7
MSTLTGVSLLDVAKTLDPDGRPAKIAELLSQNNEILLDMPWYEGNLPTGHRVTVRTGLPDVAFRKLNKGVPASKARTQQIDEACGSLEARCTVDKQLAELNGNTAAYRMQQAMAFIESMNQTMASTLFYGDTSVDPEKFLGLAPRFGDLSGPENADNIIDGAGTGTDNTSIWLIGWGTNSIHGIYPKGTKAGLAHEDLGLDDVADADGNFYRAYKDWYQWLCGVSMPDWRYVVRICNIDSSDLTKNAATGADIIDLMTQALERIHSLSGVTPVFYCNRRVRSFLRRQTVNKVASGTLAYDMVGGKPVMRFSEVPVRMCDALLLNEARVV